MKYLFKILDEKRWEEKPKYKSISNLSSAQRAAFLILNAGLGPDSFFKNLRRLALPYCNTTKSWYRNFWCCSMTFVLYSTYTSLSNWKIKQPNMFFGDKNIFFSPMSLPSSHIMSHMFMFDMLLLYCRNKLLISRHLKSFRSVRRFCTFSPVQVKVDRG